MENSFIIWNKYRFRCIEMFINFTHKHIWNGKKGFKNYQVQHFHSFVSILYILHRYSKYLYVTLRNNLPIIWKPNINFWEDQILRNLNVNLNHFSFDNSMKNLLFFMNFWWEMSASFLSSSHLITYLNSTDQHHISNNNRFLRSLLFVAKSSLVFGLISLFFFLHFVMYLH